MNINEYSITTLESFVGRELGVSDWVVVERIRGLPDRDGLPRRPRSVCCFMPLR